jgi:hypothetical protein
VDSLLYEDEPAPDVEPPRFRSPNTLYPEWHRKARCLGADMETFFGASEPDVRPPYNLADIKKARDVCEQCPVAAECLRNALQNREQYGVWAGTTRKQRKAIIARIDSGEVSIDEVVEKFEANRV